MTNDVKTDLSRRLATSGNALDFDLSVLGCPQDIAVVNGRPFRRNIHRQNGVSWPDRGHAICRPDLTLENRVILQQNGVYVKGVVTYEKSNMTINTYV